jgi:hypothetical protein
MKQNKRLLGKPKEKRLRLLKCTQHYMKPAERLLGVKVLLKSDLHRTEKNSETMTTIAEETLTKRYGPLLSINQLAALLDRSPDGLRITLRSSGEWVSKINATRLRLGRRLYFRTAEVADVLRIR